MEVTMRPGKVSEIERQAQPAGGWKAEGQRLEIQDKKEVNAEEQRARRSNCPDRRQSGKIAA